MRIKFLFVLLLTGIFLYQPAITGASVETSKTSEFKIAGQVIDTATSADGKYFFVLNSAGEVQIFDTSGKLEGTLSVDSKADLLSVSPDGSTLFLTDKEGQTTQRLNIDFIFPIPTENAPYKGDADAPVTIALFSDFQ